MKTIAYLMLVSLCAFATDKEGAAKRLNTYAPGSSAVSRTVQDKLNDSISAKDYGAKGDGTTDDTSAIQAAINSFSSGATFEIVLPGPGTYLLNSSPSANGRNPIFFLKGATTSGAGTLPGLVISDSTIVTTDTTQTITGVKTINAYLRFYNDKKVTWADSGGTQREMLWFDSSNDFHVGAQTAPSSGNGALTLYGYGEALLKLKAGPLGAGRASFTPVTNGYPTLGATSGCGAGATGPCHWGLSFLGPTSLYTDTPADPAFLSIYSGTYGEDKYIRIYGPASMSASSSYSVYWPSAAPTTGSVLGSSSGGTLAWLTNAGLPVADTTAIVKGSSDATKLLRFEVDGLTTGTTRVATWPDADVTVASTNTSQTITGAKTLDAYLAFSNNKKITMADSGGTQREMAWFDSSNDFHLGPQAAPSSGNGALSLYSKGQKLINIQAVGASTGTLEPEGDFLLGLGSNTKRFSFFKANQITLSSQASADASISLQSGDHTETKYVNIYGPASFGGAKDTYSLYLPNDDGSAGQALTTDGSGVLSWASISGAISGLTAGRIPIAASASSLTDSANLYWSGGAILNSTIFHALPWPGHAHEGGQFEIEGAGAYANWYIDSYDDQFRIFNVSASATSVQMYNTSGPFSLWVGGAVSATGAISGNSVTTNSFNMPTNAGAGKVLTSDASGNGTWQSPATPSGMMTTNTDQNVTGVKTIQTALGVDYLRIHKVTDRTTTWQHELTSDGTAYRLKDPGPNIVLQIQTTPARVVTLMGSLIPNGGATYSLGASGYAWTKLWTADVSATGNVAVGSFTMSSGGASGKVLTSDSSGNGTWQSAATPSGMMTTNTDQDVTGIKTIQTALGVDYLRIHKVTNRTTTWQHELTSDGNTYRLSDPGPNIVLQIQTTPARVATWMASLIPNGSDTYDLGTSTYYWKQSYTNTVTVGKYLSGTFSMSGNMTITGNMYNRTFSGAPSCSGVSDGWTGVDTSNSRLYVCVGGSAKYATLN